MNQRKIVHLAVCHDGARDEPPFVYALCNDGTAWRQSFDGDWMPLPLIPQNAPWESEHCDGRKS